MKSKSINWELRFSFGGVGSKLLIFLISQIESEMDQKAWAIGFDQVTSILSIRWKFIYLIESLRAFTHGGYS